MISELKLQLFLRGIRQTEIARAAGVGKSFVNRIVNGKQKASAKVAKAFREVAGVEVDTSGR